MKILYHSLIIFLLFIISIKSIHITGISFDLNNNGEFSMLVDDFNAYSRKNHLDITLEIMVFTSANSTVYTDGGKITIDSLLHSKSPRYDIYFFYYINVHGFGEHLLDLSKYISPEIIKLYNTSMFQRTCVINNRLVGFPLTRSFTALYSNKELLNKYERPIPKTWEDLLKTAEYIEEEEEKRKNNTNYINLSGLYKKDDNDGLKSFFEVLYSYRKSIELYYPDLKSQEAIEALEMYKRILNIASIAGHGYIIEKLQSGDALFIKYWGYEGKYPLYKMSTIPGWKDGISVSSIGGTDVGITKYIDENKKKSSN